MASNTNEHLAKHTVIVIGSGLAGATAAVECLRNGSDVILLEKNATLGGNSMLASSGINAINTPTQANNSIVDSNTNFFNDTMKSGAYINDTRLVNRLVNESTEASKFLGEFGVDLSEICQCGGHSVPRTHRAKPRADGKLENFGRHVMLALINYLQAQPHTKLRIVTNASVDSLLVDKEGAVVGVHYNVIVDSKATASVEQQADAVVLATGGYSANGTMMKEFGVPEHVTLLATTNGPWASGDGIRLGSKIGADVVDGNKVQLHPTGIVDPKDVFNGKKWLAPEAFRGCGGLLINQEGLRFVNELGTRDHVTDMIFKHCKAINVPKQKDSDVPPVVAYLILNDQVAKLFDLKLFEFYKSKGFIQAAANAQELCKQLGLPLENLQKTLSEYEAASKEKKDQFGKTLFPVMFSADEPLYVVLVTPSIHYTMGGLRISTECEVLAKGNSSLVIKGLFAAGEVTGGVHGGNRLAGNSLLECVVFGRIAGKNASKYHLDSASTHTIAHKSDFIDTTGVLHESALHSSQFIPLKLRSRTQLNKTSHVFTFDLPKPTDQCGLLAGQYVAVKATLGGQEVVRFYSPISRNSDFGKIDLLIKIELDKISDASMTKHLFNLKPGDALDFKGPLGGFEYHRNTYKAVGMIAGGTGISPMVQIIRSVCAHPEDATTLHLLYGNYFEDDILCKEELMYYSSTRSNVKTYITLNNPPPRWNMGVGFINLDMIKQHLPPPADDIKIVICGPLPMIKVMMPLLKQAGYTDSMVYSFV